MDIWAFREILRGSVCPWLVNLWLKFRLECWVSREDFCIKSLLVFSPFVSSLCLACFLCSLRRQQRAEKRCMRLKDRTGDQRGGSEEPLKFSKRTRPMSRIQSQRTSLLTAKVTQPTRDEFTLGTVRKSSTQNENKCKIFRSRKAHTKRNPKYSDSSSKGITKPPLELIQRFNN